MIGNHATSLRSQLVDRRSGNGARRRPIPDGLGGKLIAEGLPFAGGALTQAAPHPIIARRTWLWRADTGAVIEALGFGSLSATGPSRPMSASTGLPDLVPASCRKMSPARPATCQPDGPVLGWALHDRFTRGRIGAAASGCALCRGAARRPCRTLDAHALLETYLGRRSARQVLAGRLRRETGETIRAVLLYADLRGFTELSETTTPKAVVAALDAWFDRIAGAVHAFGGEVLKFIGDGVLAIFPVGELPPSVACDAALRAVAAARAGMAHFDRERTGQGLPPLPFGMALHLGEMLWGNIGTADRLDFTAIGPAVNLVSRLEGLCRPLGSRRAGLGRVRGGNDNGDGSYRRASVARHRRPLCGFCSAGIRDCVWIASRRSDLGPICHHLSAVFHSTLSTPPAASRIMLVSPSGEPGSRTGDSGGRRCPGRSRNGSAA